MCAVVAVDQQVEELPFGANIKYLAPNYVKKMPHIPLKTIIKQKS